jgi:hypothetical protein
MYIESSQVVIGDDAYMCFFLDNLKNFSGNL